MSDVHAAIEAGDEERVRELARIDASVAGERDENGLSALMKAKYRGQQAIADALLAAEPELDVFEAAAFGRTDRLRELLEDDPELVCARSSDTFTPLHYAAFFSSPEAARLLVDHGADVDAVADAFDAVRPLHSAAAAGRRDICALLLEAGADANARQSGGFTPLHAAAQSGDEELARMLLARRADPAAVTDDGRRPRDLGLDHLL